MRLIDADALEISTEFSDDGEYSWDIVPAFRIKSAPTIDAVHVVRCKDCVQWHRNRGVTDSPNGHCFTHDIEMNQHDFCSYGERKDGDG